MALLFYLKVGDNMSRKDWHRMLMEHRQNRPMSYSVSLISIAYGFFIIYYDGYFLGLLNPSMIGIQPLWLGLPLIVFGFLKIIGIVVNSDRIRRLGLIGMAFVWGGLLVINAIYAFGIGYPNPIWLFMGRVIFDCIFLATKGSYD